MRFGVFKYGAALLGLMAGGSANTAGAQTVTAEKTYDLTYLSDFDFNPGSNGATYSGQGFVGLFYTPLHPETDFFVPQFGAKKPQPDAVINTALEVDVTALKDITVHNAYVDFDILDYASDDPNDTGPVTGAFSLTSLMSRNPGIFLNPTASANSVSRNVTGNGSNSLDVTDLLKDRLSALTPDQFAHGDAWFGLYLTNATVDSLYTYAFDNGDPDQPNRDRANVRLVINRSASVVPEPGSRPCSFPASRPSASPGAAAKLASSKPKIVLLLYCPEALPSGLFCASAIITP